MDKEDRSFSKLFLEKRYCESDWLILRSKNLIDIAKKHNSLSALLYAAFEARNAVEQIWFELIGACHGGKIPKKILHECRKTDGIFRVMQKTAPDYRKLMRFCSICISVDPSMPVVIEWNLRRLKRFWRSLSKYCHSPMYPNDSYESQEWFSKEAFKSDSITEDQLYYRLKIMLPVLEIRTRRS